MNGAQSLRAFTITETNDVYRRHDNCGCVTTYINGKIAQNVWTKTEQTYDGELLEQDGSGEPYVLEGKEQGKGVVGEERKERIASNGTKNTVNEKSSLG